MRSVMFALFVVISGASLGVSLFVIPIRYALWRKTGERRQLWHLILKAGVSLLVGLFLFLVLPNREAHNIPPNAATWTYLTALSLIAVGAMGLAAGAIRTLLDTEVPDKKEEA